MSAQEIIAELPKLNPDELRLVKARLSQLEAAAQTEPRSGWGGSLSGVIATADDLPDDLALQHDHYLYGRPSADETRGFDG